MAGGQPRPGRLRAETPPLIVPEKPQMVPVRRRMTDRTLRPSHRSLPMRLLAAVFLAACLVGCTFETTTSSESTVTNSDGSKTTIKNETKTKNGVKTETKTE